METTTAHRSYRAKSAHRKDALRRTYRAAVAGEELIERALADGAVQVPTKTRSKAFAATLSYWRNCYQQDGIQCQVFPHNLPG